MQRHRSCSQSETKARRKKMYSTNIHAVDELSSRKLRTNKHNIKSPRSWNICVRRCRDKVNLYLYIFLFMKSIELSNRTRRTATAIVRVRVDHKTKKIKFAAHIENKNVKNMEIGHSNGSNNCELFITLARRQRSSEKSKKFVSKISRKIFVSASRRRVTIERMRWSRTIASVSKREKK